MNTFNRRKALRLGLAVPAAAAAPQLLTSRVAAAATGVRHEIRRLEQRYDRTVGLYAANLRTGASIAHRAHHRFAICSVFKALAVAAVLRDRDQHGEVLDRRIFYTDDEVVENSPVTKDHVDGGMTVRELCDAALRFSDNTAANLLLRQIGGPRGITRFARSLGDRLTRLDRWETELNTAHPHDLRDTTTPAAIAATFGQLLVGDALSRPDRELLLGWMLDNQTSDTRFRAPGAIPDGWAVADKTGGGGYASVNDVGVTWTPDGAPIVIAALTRSDDADAAGVNPLLADLAALACDRLS